MDRNSNGAAQDQDMDLSDISKKIGGFFSSIGNGLFRVLLFFKRNLLFFSIIFLIGAALGVFLDKNTKSYKHQLIVTPNFGSVDYLYTKIDLINSKIKERDTVFLKSIGIVKPKKLSGIEIEPIIDIYNFVNDKTHSVNNAQNTQNFELVKLLSEDGDINKVIKEDITSKNYARHSIKISTDGPTNPENTIIPILAYLNNNAFYNSLQKTYLVNTGIKMQQDQAMIAQIDGLLNQFSAASNQKSDKLVYYNDNNQINDMLNTKNYLIGELGGLRMELIGSSKVIKDNSSVINVRDKDGLNNKLKFVLPLLLVFLAVCFKLITSFIRSQHKKQASLT